jgi:diaphanous 1
LDYSAALKDVLRLSAPPKRPPLNKAFSDFELSSHLHKPLLRLVYLPLCLELCFLSVPDVPEHATCTFFVGGLMTMQEILSAILDEYRLKRSIQQGPKTASIQYIIRLPRSGEICRPDETLFAVLERCQLNGPPFHMEVTLSPQWLSKVGTVALGLTKSSPARANVRTAAWRPSSMFGLWSSPVSEEDGEGDVSATTVKPSPNGAMPTRSSPSTRLSTLFDNWMPAEGSPAAAASKRRTVSAPVPIADEVRPQSPPSLGLGITSEEVQDLAASHEDLDGRFEELIRELGIKESQQAAMRQLSDDRKRFLLQQQQSVQKNPPLRAQLTGPPAEASAFQNLKRFSLAAVGLETDSAASTYKGHSPASSISSMALSTITSPPPTASGWTSWFSAPNASKELQETPAWFVQQLQNAKHSPQALTKTLIGLRVRLATEQLGWIKDFVDTCAGVAAISELLKKNKSMEADDGLKLECVKCLRILLNTEVRVRITVMLAHAAIRSASHESWTTLNLLPTSPSASTPLLASYNLM